MDGLLDRYAQVCPKSTLATENFHLYAIHKV